MQNPKNSRLFDFFENRGIVGLCTTSSTTKTSTLYDYLTIIVSKSLFGLHLLRPFLRLLLDEDIIPVFRLYISDLFVVVLSNLLGSPRVELLLFDRQLMPYFRCYFDDFGTQWQSVSFRYFLAFSTIEENET